MLDIDDTEDRVHGGGNWRCSTPDSRCFQPIHIYEATTGKPVAIILRPGKTPDGAEVTLVLRHVIGHIRARWPAVEIVVRDEGPGIPPGALDRLFHKFYRADAGDRQRAGTGLGLAIAKGFVEALGGVIAARNRTDRSGAEFIVRYPVS